MEFDVLSVKVLNTPSRGGGMVKGTVDLSINGVPHTLPWECDFDGDDMEMGDLNIYPASKGTSFAAMVFIDPNDEDDGYIEATTSYTGGEFISTPVPGALRIILDDWEVMVKAINAFLNDRLNDGERAMEDAWIDAWTRR